MSAGAVIIMRIKNIFAFLRGRDATAPQRAVPKSEVPFSDRWYFRRLVEYGAVKIHDGKCYLDEEVAQQYLKRRQTRALLFLGLVLSVVIIYLVVVALIG